MTPLRLLLAPFLGLSSPFPFPNWPAVERGSLDYYAQVVNPPLGGSFSVESRVA